MDGAGEVQQQPAQSGAGPAVPVPISRRGSAWLAFHDSRLETQWQLEWAKAQGALDIAFGLQTMLLPSLVARLVSPAASAHRL